MEVGQWIWDTSVLIMDSVFCITLRSLIICVGLMVTRASMSLATPIRHSGTAFSFENAHGEAGIVMTKISSWLTLGRPGAVPGDLESGKFRLLGSRNQ